MKTTIIRAILGVAVAFPLGCSSAEGPSDNDTAEVQSVYLLETEPVEAQEVVATKAAVGEGEDLVVTGRIGGSTRPWIDDRAAFMIVDSSLPPCQEGCPTPWDYCCESDLASSTLLVKIVDGNNQLVQVDARKLLGVSELDHVVVRGKAQRDEEGNLTVLANGVYVKKS